MGFVYGPLRERSIELPQGFWPKLPRLVRDLKGLPAVLARSGSLELRLATTKGEIRKAQRLRFTVFFEEGGAVPARHHALTRRDKCGYDRICDHLLVVDTAFARKDGSLSSKIVGTYRLLRGDVARDSGHGFYSATEFAVDALLDRHPEKRFLELGRSCVHRDYRSKRVIDLLWRGIGVYAAHHASDVMIGCASLPGTSADALATPLSFAFHHAAASPSWQVAAVAGRAVAMDRLPKDAIEPRRAMAALPPLLKAYIRAGCGFATEAVTDHQFGTTDLFTVLPLASADRRYIAHFASVLSA